VVGTPIATVRRVNSSPAEDSRASEVDVLADVVARLRRALRRGVRTEVPFEALSVAQVELLQSIADTPGVRAGALAERLLLAPTTVSTLVAALLDGGLLDRGRDPRDGRAYVLALTEEGRERLDAWQRATTGVLASALDGLSAADRQTLQRAVPALDRLVAALDTRPRPEP